MQEEGWRKVLTERGIAPQTRYRASAPWAMPSTLRTDSGKQPERVN